MGSSETPIAPSTIFTLNREPICPLRRSIHSRTRLRAKITANTSKAAVSSVVSAKNTANSLPRSGRSGTSSDPTMNTAAVSNVTTIPPIHGHSRFFTLARSTFNARPPDAGPAENERTRSVAMPERVPIASRERSETHGYRAVGAQNAYF